MADFKSSYNPPPKWEKPATSCLYAMGVVVGLTCAGTLYAAMLLVPGGHPFALWQFPLPAVAGAAMGYLTYVIGREN